MNQNIVRQAIFNYPMSPDDFRLAQEARIQDIMLNDSEMLREAIRNRDRMVREEQRSMLRQQEMVQKQQMRITNTEIYQTDYGISLQIVNGVGQILQKVLLFSCRIVGMQRFFRAVTKERFWQVEILTNGDRIFSNLYPADCLKFPNRLRNTILGRYDCSVGSGDMAIAWKWMRNELVKLYEDAQEIGLPFLAGWFYMNKKWTFWTKTEENMLLASDVIERFSMKTFPSLDMEGIADELFSAEESFGGQENLGVLLIFSLVALLSRFVADSPLQIGLTLVGAEAVKVAKSCLCTMDSGEGNCDLANLDADRMDRIQENLQHLQDTPFILVSLDSDNKSTKNRLSRIKSWMESGYVEGQRVTVPFVFCLRKISPLYPLDGTAIIMTDEITVPDGFDSFAKFWAFIIARVEEGGDYWPKEFKRQYKLLKEDWDKDEGFLRTCDAILFAVFRMLSLDEDRTERLNDIFSAGMNGIKEQLDTKTDAIIDIFKSGIEELVDAKEIVFARTCLDLVKGTGEIYYDDEFYYFPKAILGQIQEELELDRKAVLFIKQRLAADGFVKRYQVTGGSHSELEVDIWIGTKESKKRLSVFAIKRFFWDEFGGIPLCER